MKMTSSLIALCALTVVALAGEATTTVPVAGNCGSCKKRIVKAASSVGGVKAAAWDKKDKVLTITFDDATHGKDALVKDVTMAITKVGHDVDTTKAPTKAYESLPDCCRYRDHASTH